MIGIPYLIRLVKGQSIPMGPRGEMMLRPMPAPRNRRVGLNCRACAHTLPASTNVLT